VKRYRAPVRCDDSACVHTVVVRGGTRQPGASWCELHVTLPQPIAGVVGPPRLRGCGVITMSIGASQYGVRHVRSRTPMKPANPLGKHPIATPSATTIGFGVPIQPPQRGQHRSSTTAIAHQGAGPPTPESARTRQAPPARCSCPTAPDPTNLTNRPPTPFYKVTNETPPPTYL